MCYFNGHKYRNAKFYYTLQGDMGIQGPQGPQGLKGNVGLPGKKGDFGPPGAPGTISFPDGISATTIKVGELCSVIKFLVRITCILNSPPLLITDYRSKWHKIHWIG